MQKKLQLTNLDLLWNCFHDFLSGFREYVRHNKIKGELMTFLFFLFSISGYSQLATESFEGGIPASWTLYQNSFGVSTWAISAGNGYLSTNAAFINPAADNIGAGNTAQYYMVTPQVSVPANGEIRFWTKQGSATNNGTTYELRISTATSSINDFGVLLQSWDETTLNTTATTYEEKVIAIPAGIPAGTPVYFAFVAKNTQTGAAPTGDSWFVDNARVITACPKVQQANFTTTNLTSNSATLSWTHPSASNFEIQIVPQATAPAATGTATTSSYNASSLAANTNYDVYIKALCDPITPSGWAGPFPFKTLIVGTLCADPIVILPTQVSPYVLSANLKTFKNPAMTYTTQGTGGLPAGVTGNYLNGDKAFFKFTPTQTGLITITTNPDSTTGPLGGATPNGCFGNVTTGTFVYQDCASVGVTCLAGARTTTANVPSKISNLYVQAGLTYYIALSTTLASDAGICFTFKVEFSQCAAPSVYTYKNLLQNTASFTWNNVGNLASAWEYLVLPAAAAAPTAATSGTPTATNIDVPISGLTAGTAYKLYVRSVCGGTPGPWGTPYGFTTQCNVFPTPYSQAFTGATAAAPTACWTPIDVNNDGATWSYLSNAATMVINTLPNNNYDMLASPQVNFTGVQKRLRYKFSMAGGGTAKYSVRISNTGVGATNFVTELLPETSITNTTLQEKIINIPVSYTGPINIAFVVAPGTGATATRVSIDDVFIEDKPTCPDPITPLAQNVTTTTADLKWTIGDVETQWQVAIQPLGSGVPTGAGVLVSVGDSNVAFSTPNVTYSATGLNPAIRYEYYVRAYCSSTQTSSWVGPLAFTTLCGSFNAPYTETFNDTDPNTKKFCWSINDANTDNLKWSITAGGEADIRRGFFAATGFNDWLISPAINAVGNKKLSFKYRALQHINNINPKAGIQVLISTTDTNPTSFTEIMPWTEFNNTVYLEKSLYFTGSGPVYIAFRVPPGIPSPDMFTVLNIDDVKIEDAPACPDAFGLASTNVTQSTVALTWKQGYAETQWEVAIQPQGTGTPTGAGTLVGVGTPGFSFTAPNAVYNATGLAPDTKYEVYVRAYCSASSTSNWTGPITLRTLCSPINAPFTETFNTTSTTEDCWRTVNANNDNSTWTMNNTTYPYEGNNAAAIFTGFNGANNDWLISPTINVTANQRLHYYYRVNATDFTEDLNIKLSTNGIGLSDFTTILYDSSTDPVLINNVTYKEKIINLPAGITGNVNIAFQVPFHAPEPWGYRGQLLVIDKIMIEDIPTCSQPANIVHSNVTDVSVQLAWDTDANVNSWEVSLQPFGTPAPVGNTSPSYLHTTTTNGITINGLTPAVKYQYYVRSVCGSNQTTWVGPFEFTTRCSYNDLCQYTITLNNGANGSGPAGPVQVIQNGVVLQNMTFPSSTPSTQAPAAVFPVFLCNGVQFSVFWDAIGTAPNQWPNATVSVSDASGNIVWTSAPGLGIPRRVMYTGVSACSTITCPKPTNLTVSNQSVLSWTAGGSETQWEVYIQPVNFGALPQSGTIVSTNSYTPTAADFNNQTAATYEYFVRAICGAGNASFWSGPFQFVRNDEPANATVVTVNETDTCATSSPNVSFIGATVSSAVPSSCAAINNGDVWLQFTATQKIHIIEVNGFTGSFYYASGDLPFPDIMMTLYKQEANGTLTQIACSNNNVITAMYTSELIPGQNYKVRLALNGATPNGVAPNSRLFSLCVRTPQDFCSVDAANYDFEYPKAPFGGVSNFCTQYVVPGWRENLLTWNSIFFVESATSSASGYLPYSGGQAIQVLNDPAANWDPTDLVNVRGHYKEFDTSEITKMDYSFAHSSRFTGGTTIQLYAGPPSGPFTLVTEQYSVAGVWQLVQGSYAVPAGQTTTRFVFRTKDNAIGHLLDAANFKANVAIKTANKTLTCSETSTIVAAEGVGEWSADPSNPAITIIDTPNTTSTTISGFNTAGVYVYHWKTRYCDKTMTITYQGITQLATVNTPVVYCTDEVALPLTATVPSGYTLMWYTQAVGGIGNATAPTPITTTAGSTTYYVSAVDASGCIGPRTSMEVVVNAKITPVVGFTYDAAQYCMEGSTPVMTTTPGFSTGGIFTVSPATGLNVNSTTGTITISGSTPGIYTITYNVAPNNATCNLGGTNSFVMTITESPVVQIEDVCEDHVLLLKAMPVNGSFNPSSANYTWKDYNNVTIGTNAPTLNVDEYLTQNPSASLPLSFSVSIDSDNCTSETSFVVQDNPCKMIPKGISPNNDGFNDSFDLTGLDVNEVVIFNRYGTKVYSFGGNYTNQWSGQSNGGDKLPDGTYFYTIQKESGATVTGWVYINR